MPADEPTTEVHIGYTLSSEEHPPNQLVDHAVRAEQVGFEFCLVSDHFHPWTDTQGHSPFVWAVIGGVARSTSTIRLGTGVTCPVRMHPALVAQAAASAACMMPGRFFLGLGSGENLNEHVVGQHWPPVPVRQERLAESVDVIRTLWSGRRVNHRGAHYVVEDARIYTLPSQPVEIMIAAAGAKAAKLAAEKGEGLIGVSPKAELVQAYVDAGGRGPRYGQVHVCWAATEEEAKRTAYQWWPNVAMEGMITAELRLPAEFEQVALLVNPDDVARGVVCGPDPERYVAKIREYVEAGFDHVYLHQIGPDQEGFFTFFERELAPRLQMAEANA
ncbi:MAG TPA: TIGR03557 family F420-dependent LLM class oxidoreductase [Candidatus Dormibacteraeota bacterium]|jgi:G6PDH family F420-dependent oxidoreductase|nr:TIGR03557 family F420-dependent LLM class oxidoreductase [Candidatus Dormibacteraeota bacterium]